MPCQIGDIQEIPDDDNVSRLVYYPAMFDEETLSQIDPLQAFHFRSKRPEPGNRGESVVWRAYAPNNSDVHNLGLEALQTKLARKRNGEATPTYRGFITAQVEAVRNARLANHRSFRVEHAPCEGLWHAEIKVDDDISKQEKADLRKLLFSVFDDLVEPAETS